MYTILLTLHSLFRWLVLACLLFSIYRAYKGFSTKRPFTSVDNRLRHWTATIAHIQLILGFWLYLQSPVVKFFFSNPSAGSQHSETLFFSALHILLMLVAITVITIGSALAKRRNTDAEKFKTMLNWFCLGLLIIFLAIPWPFSPLAARPYFRSF